MNVIFVEIKLSEDDNSLSQDVSISIILPTYYFLPNLFETLQSKMYWFICHRVIFSCAMMYIVQISVFTITVLS